MQPHLTMSKIYKSMAWVEIHYGSVDRAVNLIRLVIDEHCYHQFHEITLDGVFTP